MTRITLPELINLRRALPPLPADTGRASLSERFLLPPFTVLDARQGYWQRRKRMWLDLGIQSELGRGDTPGTHYSPQAAGHYRANAVPGGTLMPAATLGADGRTRRGDGRGRRLAKAFNIGMDADKDNGWSTEDSHGSGTSIFDPVICELVYRWFCPQAGRVLDPFAGGSVRGVVAARLGRGYAGVDLRPEQVDANHTQAGVICPGADLRWVTGDARDVADLLPGEYDLVFSCPPYADLERYSDDPRDLSTMAYPQFLEEYRHIITVSCAMLRNDRFACFVVGDVRDRETGNYRGFVGDTIAAFRAAGLELYNDAVLVTSVGSLPIRVGKQFAGYRKLGKTHQNVLVFLKGDAGRATAACGPVDVDDLPMPPLEQGAVAVCAQDVAGLEAEGYVDGDGTECPVLPMPTLEACLTADIIRGEARAAGVPVPRVWVGTPEGWRRVEDGVELSYVIGGEAYLSQALFPGTRVPTGGAPAVRRMW